MKKGILQRRLHHHTYMYECQKKTYILNILLLSFFFSLRFIIQQIVTFVTMLRDEIRRQNENEDF